MVNHWALKTRGNPLEAVRQFIAGIWLHAKLERILLPLKNEGEPMWEAQITGDPSHLERSNPFSPLMTRNAAKQIPEILNQHADANTAALLRPCEMRALIEMSKRSSLDWDRIITISVDCLGTFPEHEYSWRVERKGSPEELTQESLQFSRQGGIVPYRYRSACQVCEMPIAQSANINIGVVGLPVRKYIMVTTSNGISDRISFEDLTDGVADPEIVSQYEKTATKVIYRRVKTRYRVMKALSENIPPDVETLILQLEECGDCQKCLQECPICSVETPQRGEDGLYRRDSILRWLVSCVGCGMCVQSCPVQKPLNFIFASLREQLADLTGYTPGSSIDLPLLVKD
jgi:formate dehydrogenase subunit beta